MKYSTLRECSVASRWGGMVLVIFALAGSSALAQSRSGALGSGGIGQVGRSQGSLFSVPGYFAFDSYTVGADQFFKPPRAVNNRLMSVNLRRSRGPGSGPTGRSALGGAPAYYVPGMGDLRRPGARYILPQPMNGPVNALTADPFGLAGVATRTGVTRVTPYTPNGRIAPAPRTPFLYAMTGARDTNPLFYDALTNPQTDATHDAFAITGGVAPNRLRELENAANFSPASRPDGQARDDPPQTDALDLFAARRRAKFAAYLNQAWAHFRARDYQRAAATFGLASRADATQTEAVRGRFYAVLLIERFAVGGTLFNRLLRDDAKLFDRPGDLRQRFDDPAEYRAFVERLRTHAEDAQAAPALVALYAYVLWQQGEMFSARTVARRAAGSDPRSPYARMITRMVAEPASSVAPSRPSAN